MIVEFGPRVKFVVGLVVFTVGFSTAGSFGIVLVEFAVGIVPEVELVGVLVALAVVFITEGTTFVVFDGAVEF